MTDFFLTQMGRRFYESTMPGLVKQLADLNANLRKQNKPDDNATANPLLCSKHGGCGFQSDCAKCRHEEYEERAAASGAASIREEEDREIAATAAHHQFLERVRKLKMSEPHKVSEASTVEEIKASDNRVIRENFVEYNRRGVMGEVTHSEAVTMLLSLLARIHRDGGHHTEQVGLAKSVFDADIRVAYLNGQIDEPGTITRDNMYRADLKSLANETDETCHTDMGTRVLGIIRELKEQRTRAEKQTRKFADSEGQAVKSEIAARASELSLKQELESVTKRLIELDDNFMKLHAQHRDTVEELEALRDRLEKGPPWLAEAAQALGAVQPNGEPLALNWTQVLAQIRHINAELNVERKHVDTLQQERDGLWSENQGLKEIVRGLDLERELRSRAEVNLVIEKDAHQFTRQLHATALQRGIDFIQKLDLVNQKLGIKMEDSFEHFREQINNALDDD